MSDEPELTPQEQEVRRLLADARHAEPMPAEVVSRLDRVLAGLADEPARVAPVADLATRRRRAAGLLVAAAAVLVVGIGLGQLGVPGGFSGSAEESSADREVVSERAAGGAADAQEDGDAASAPEESAPQDAEALPDSPASGAVSPKTLTASAFSDQVSDLQRALPRSSAAPVVKRWSRTRAAARACEAPSWGEGTFVAVRYDGFPGVVVFRSANGDTQVADLYLCGATEPERSITLPAP